MAPEYRRQSYEEYAGLYTEKMKQLAIEGGCETFGEMEAWFDFNYPRGREENRNSPPIPYKYFRHYQQWRPRRGKGRDTPLRSE